MFEPSAATPFCQAMLELELANPGVPERLHPKSFHSMFGHNTNVWATRNQQVRDDAGCCGLLVAHALTCEC